MTKKLNWSSSKRRKIHRTALSIKEETDRMKTDAAAKWLKKAERRAANKRIA
jgi:hypothetical protein